MSNPSTTPAKQAKSKRTGITRSIVFRKDVLKAAKQRAADDKRNLSNWLNNQLSEVLGLAK